MSGKQDKRSRRAMLAMKRNAKTVMGAQLQHAKTAGIQEYIRAIHHLKIHVRLMYCWRLIFWRWRRVYVLSSVLLMAIASCIFYYIRYQL